MPDKNCTGVHRPNDALGPLIKPSLWNAARQRARIQVPLPGVDVRHWPVSEVAASPKQTSPLIAESRDHHIVRPKRHVLTLASHQLRKRQAIIRHVR